MDWGRLFNSFSGWPVLFFSWGVSSVQSACSVGGVSVEVTAWMGSSASSSSALYTSPSTNIRPTPALENIFSKYDSGVGEGHISSFACEETKKRGRGRNPQAIREKVREVYGHLIFPGTSKAQTP